MSQTLDQCALKKNHAISPGAKICNT